MNVSKSQMKPDKLYLVYSPPEKFPVYLCLHFNSPIAQLNFQRIAEFEFKDEGKCKVLNDSSQLRPFYHGTAVRLNDHEWEIYFLEGFISCRFSYSKQGAAHALRIVCERIVENFGEE